MKKVLCIIFVLVFAVALTGCGVEIADTNGPDDTSLATITEENIINMDMGGGSYSMSPSSEDENYMTTSTTFKGKEYSGVTEIYSENYIGKSDFMMDVSFINVKEGNFKLVVVLDDEIVHEFDNTIDSQTCELRDIKGYLSVRIVGETANFKMSAQAW